MFETEATAYDQDESSTLNSAKTKENARKHVKSPTRRSERDPQVGFLQRTDVKAMLDKIESNHTECIIFKVKQHTLADISSSVVDSIIEAFHKNSNCQALYMQNLSKAIKDPQIFAIIDLLIAKQNIWCLNIGENYEICIETWKLFCKSLPNTCITHLYVSEHVIPIDLKNQMRFNIRQNRKKHDLHCSLDNIKIIEKCTNMWWNPINGVKYPMEENGKVKIELTPAHTAYWQEGVGPGGDKPWKFNCSCGETCSSYERFIYHPIGMMYECSQCSIWSHVECVLGSKVTADDLEEMEGLLCSTCQSRRQRRFFLMKRCLLKGEKIPLEEWKVSPPHQKDKGPKRKKLEVIHREVTNNNDDDPETQPWKFSCICGEVCSYYENKRYHPKGRWYQCTRCDLWGHVVCILGPKISDEKISSMKDVFCNTCRTKARRDRRSIRNEAEEEQEVVPTSTSGPDGDESLDSEIAHVVLTTEELINDQPTLVPTSSEEIILQDDVLHSNRAINELQRDGECQTNPTAPIHDDYWTTQPIHNDTADEGLKESLMRTDGCD